MPTREKDTLPDARSSAEASPGGERRDTLPMRTSETPLDDGPVAAASTASPMNRSDIEPMDVMLRKLAESKQQVPNSLEPNIEYHAVHSPARPHHPPAQPPVVLDITTDPIPRALRIKNPLAEAPTVLLERQPLAPRIALAVIAALIVAGAIFWAARFRGASETVTPAASPRIESFAGTATVVAKPTSSTPSPTPAAASPLPVESAAVPEPTAATPPHPVSVKPVAKPVPPKAPVGIGVFPEDP